MWYVPAFPSDLRPRDHILLNGSHTPGLLPHCGCYEWCCHTHDIGKGQHASPGYYRLLAAQRLAVHISLDMRDHCYAAKAEGWDTVVPTSIGRVINHCWQNQVVFPTLPNAHGTDKPIGLKTGLSEGGEGLGEALGQRENQQTGNQTLSPGTEDTALFSSWPRTLPLTGRLRVGHHMGLEGTVLLK